MRQLGWRVLWAVVVLGSLCAATARAVTIVDPQSPPPGLAPGTIYQRLFVTSSSFSISSSTAYPPIVGVGGLAGADYNVTFEAYQAGWMPDWDGHEVPFRAILSDGTTDARDRLTIAVPIFNMANELFANDAADLWHGSIAHAIRYDPFGQAVPDGIRVWTGTVGYGFKFIETCGNWLNPNVSGMTGSPSVNNANWLANVPQSCSGSARLYAVSPALVVPQPGDFNGNGTVDAADYVVWRKNAGGASEYDLWREHFGTSVGGSGASQAENAAVPEPTTVILACVGSLLVNGTLRRRAINWTLARSG